MLLKVADAAKILPDALLDTRAQVSICSDSEKTLLEEIKETMAAGGETCCNVRSEHMLAKSITAPNEFLNSCLELIRTSRTTCLRVCSDLCLSARLLSGRHNSETCRRSVPVRRQLNINPRSWVVPAVFGLLLLAFQQAGKI